jgi:hypothetical protein
MDPLEFRERMNEFWRSATKDASERKDPHLGILELNALYESFDAEERNLADQVIAGWALSDDEGKRFDALSLISDYAITTAAPLLAKLADRLRTTQTPGAPFELEKVEKILLSLRSTK